MKTEKSQISKPHVLILNFTVKIDLRRDEWSIPLSNLSIYYTWKNIKSPYNNNKFKILAPTWNDIPVQIFKIILSIFQKNMEKLLKILQ